MDRVPFEASAMDRDSILMLPHSNRLGARATPRTRGSRDAYAWVQEGSFLKSTTHRNLAACRH